MPLSGGEEVSEEFKNLRAGGGGGGGGGGGWGGGGGGVGGGGGGISVILCYVATRKKRKRPPRLLPGGRDRENDRGEASEKGKNLKGEGGGEEAL